MDKLFGLPAHPFLVHIPIVLLPLSAIGVVALVARRSWYLAYRWVVLAVAAVGTAGAVLAASAGDQLEERITAVEGPQTAASWQHHAELGETARNIALVYFVVLTVYVVAPWFLQRRAGEGVSAERPSRAPRWLPPVLAALALLGAAGSVATIVRAGHTGSKSVWSDYVDKTGDGG